jgi:glycosyltransferase involved in cell wall biosynthesis
MVSVIVPVFNAEKSIRRCLDSVFGQTRRAHEVIVVVDGSTDASADIVRGYGDAVRFIRQANAGPSAARNAGLSVAGGQYVALLDADDYWLPEFLQTCVSFLQSHPDAAAVSTGQRIKNWGHEEVICPAILRSAQAGEARVLDDFFDFWAKHNHITTGSIVIRREVLSASGGQRPDLRLCEDLEFWGYLATFGKWGFIPQALFVSDGAVVEAAQGWYAKHRIRWQTCPTVEVWESRIEPRLKEKDWPGFRVMRGRIAKIVAHSKILAGQDDLALQTVRKYREAFPTDRMGRLLIMGSIGGGIGWKTLCRLLRFREWLKAVMIFITVRKRTTRPQE